MGKKKLCFACRFLFDCLTKIRVIDLNEDNEVFFCELRCLDESCCNFKQYIWIKPLFEKELVTVNSS